jgi:pimeloyl-ACP methyl ester carboxylesterase
MTSAERVHTFGPKNTLVGVVTLPTSDKKDDSEARPFIILLNAGLMHRAGPFRLSVHLARQIAERGFRVLRFDQTGLGDSAPNPERVPLSEQIVDDAREAMKFLSENYAAKNFVFGGLCSGAVNAHRIALADDRVVGMWMLDGYAYPTRTYYKHTAIRWIRKRQEAAQGKPLALIRRIAKDLTAQARTRIKAKLGKTPDHTASPDSVSSAQANGNFSGEGDPERDLVFFLDDWPDIRTVRGELEKILDRGVSILFVYTGGWSNFVDERQFDEMFPKLRNGNHRGSVVVKYYPEADHTYVALSDRHRMVRDVGDFIDTTVSSQR